MLRPRISDMVTIASRLSGVPETDILSPARPLHLCAVRFAVYATARAWKYSYPEIGKVMHRDHSTVLSGMQTRRRLESYIADFDGFCDAVAYWSDELPPFVSETDWTPPGIYMVYPSEQVRQARAKGVALPVNAEGNPKVSATQEPRDFDMEISHATAAAIGKGSSDLLDALRRAA
ncbi:helix-turn-helix domain-containing protein [Novosphingobium lindaniclasticum]